MIKFFRHILNLMRFLQLPKENRRLVFYSEGKNYWVHLQGIIFKILESADIPVCYISSGEDDPGLDVEHDNFRSFKIDESFIRDYLFKNIDTDVMVLTMPDLHQYQVKRSLHSVHYVYVQHSLVSLHMAYRKGAFDYFDTVFCAGPHHVKEVRKMEQYYGLAEKNIVEHGYGRLDAIINESIQRDHPKKTAVDLMHILIAPSWGDNGIIETIGEQLVDILIEKGHKITLRPHPQTIKYAKQQVENIVNKHKNKTLFRYEENVAGQDSLHDSDLMISDWSGAALDYAFGLNKPVIFIDVPRKVNNKDYEELQIEPFEVDIRSQIGRVVTLDTLDEIHTEMNINKDIAKRNVFNISTSDEVGANYIIGLLEKQHVL